MRLPHKLDKLMVLDEDNIIFKCREVLLHEARDAFGCMQS